MSKRKQSFCILLFVVLLIVAAAAPILLMTYENSRMLNRVTVSTLSSEETEEKNTTRVYDTRKRLEIIRLASGVIEQQTELLSEEQQGDIVREMKEQLESLADAEVLPRLGFSDEYSATVHKKTYIISQNPNDSVSIWTIFVQYLEFQVVAYMDINTSLLYGFNIISYNNNLSYVPSAQPEEGFLTYLLLEGKSPGGEGQSFCADTYYGENIISVFVAIYDEKIQQVSSYNLGDYGISGKKVLKEYTTIEHEEPETEVVPAQ